MRLSIRFLSLIPLHILISFIFLSSTLATADVVKLKNGGEIRGKVDWKKSSAKSTTVSITTLSGAAVLIAREDIVFASHRSLKIEEYETRAKQTDDTVAAQWEMAEWCRVNRLKKQRKIHLEKIVAIEPDHPKARLGLAHSLHNGKWMTRETWMTSQGYVKYKNRYITPQELELINKNEEELLKERAWYAKVKLWFGWMMRKNDKRQKTGYDNLVSLTDPNAVPALTKIMSEHQQYSVRQFFIKQMTKMEGAKPVRPLVNRVLLDSSSDLRYAALNGLSEDQYKIAMPYFLKKLKSEHNAIVRRAGAGLERVGNEQAVPYLVEALITTHQYKVRVPKKGVALGVGGGGNMAPLSPDIQAMLQSGQFSNGVIINQQDMIPNQLRPMKTITVDYHHNNPEVLTALQKITGQSFGYNERTWRLWWTTKKNGAIK